MCVYECVQANFAWPSVDPHFSDGVQIEGRGQSWIEGSLQMGGHNSYPPLSSTPSQWQKGFPAELQITLDVEGERLFLDLAQSR